MNSNQRHKQYWANAARFGPDPEPRPRFILTPGQPLKLTDAWRLLVVNGMSKEGAAKRLGLSYSWEVL